MYDIIVYENTEITHRYCNLPEQGAKRIYNMYYDLSCCPDVYKNGVRLRIGQAYNALRRGETKQIVIV